MKIENENEYIYYYFIKDEEALPALMNYYKPMVISINKIYCNEDYYIEHTFDDYMAMANMTLVESLHKYRYDTKASFFLFYYANLKYRTIDLMRCLYHSSFPAKINTISLDLRIREDSNMYYRDVISHPYKINEESYILGKCQADYLLQQAKIELSEKDFMILEYKSKGYSVADICEIMNVSKQYVYYRLKKIRNWFNLH